MKTAAKTATDTETIKTDKNQNTRLLVKLHINDRHRLAEASALTGKSQQSIVRNGICAILDSILANAPIKESRKTHVKKVG
jgi:hypothetical protein